MKRQRDQKYRECVVYERAHIPPEYLPLGDLHESEQTVHRYLVKQCEAGNARRFRLGRLLFVHADDIQAARLRHEQRQQSAANSDDRVLRLVEQCLIPDAFDCLNAIAGSLEEAVKSLERLTTAVESIATQPKTTNDHALATVASGNGFHN